MRSRDEIESMLASAKTPADVDSVLLEILARTFVGVSDVPDYIGSDPWKWVEIDEHGHTLRMLVAPDYFAVGNPPLRMARTRPFGAQDVADHYDAILPSRKILRAIQYAASPRIGFLDVKGAPYHIPVLQIETEEALERANDMADDKFAELGIAPGEGLTIGYKKAIVSGPNLDGSKVAIFGGIGGNLDPETGRKEIVQAYYTGHPSSYSDDSHGIVLVSRKAELDGRPVDLRRDVFGSSDPSIVALVNDHYDGAGRLIQFDPIFPNAGPESRAEFGGSLSGAPSPSKPAAPKPPSGGSKGATKKPSPTPAGQIETTSTKIVGGAALGFGVLAILTWLFF
jgi:hypothetical protein